MKPCLPAGASSEADWSMGVGWNLSSTASTGNHCERSSVGRSLWRYSGGGMSFGSGSRTGWSEAVIAATTTIPSPFRLFSSICG